MFATPWEDVLLVGTTDTDHNEDLFAEPAITPEEVSYLMEGLQDAFPDLDFSLKDCLSSFAGIRPVLSAGHKAPSKESREHVVWVDKGLVTVTGGKLTTFRRVATDALKAARAYLPSCKAGPRKGLLFSPVICKAHKEAGVSSHTWRRLCGRYGNGAEVLITRAAPEDLETIAGTRTLWAELPFVARREKVRHLSDLMLRRVRIGLLSPSGGARHMDRIQELCAPVMSWDKERWKKERDSYRELWKCKYALPESRSAPEGRIS